MRTYATATDLLDFMGGEAPTGPDGSDLSESQTNALLRRASAQVESYVRLARYAVDEDGYPTDPDVSQALTDATCAQAAWWDETGDVTGADATAGPTMSLSVSLGGNGTAANQRTSAEARVSAEAVTILRNAGLITARIDHY